MLGDYITIVHSYNSALSLRTNSIAAVSRLFITTICFFYFLKKILIPSQGTYPHKNEK